MGRTKRAPKRNADFTVSEARRYRPSDAHAVLDAAVVATASNDDPAETPSGNKKKRVAFGPVLEQTAPTSKEDSSAQQRTDHHFENINNMASSANEEEPPTPPPVEISIEETDGDAKKWKIKLRLLSDDNSREPVATGTRTRTRTPCLIMQRCRLRDTLLVTVEPTDNNENDQDQTHQDNLTITTRQGVTCLLHHCKSRSTQNEGNESTNSHEKDWDSVVDAVQDGTMLLTCCRTAESDSDQDSVLEISLWLTPRAFEVSCPAYLPIASRRSRTSKKQRVNRNLQAALGWLFPQSVLADVVNKPKSGSSSSSSITAKMIYRVTDNVQLLQRSKEDGKPMRRIPGLVPKLRPYQEEAVKWMLEREQCGYTTRHCPRNLSNEKQGGREWEMAWIVLSTWNGKSSSNNGNECIQQTPTAVTPLYQWNQDSHNAAKDNALLFCCPFAGWLATSYEEARTFSIQTVIPSWNPETDPLPCVSGGILADSMGLGKTVEVLACILANPKNPEKKHVVRKLDFSVGALETDGEEETKQGNDRAQIVNTDGEHLTEDFAASAVGTPACVTPLGGNRVMTKRQHHENFATPPPLPRQWERGGSVPANTAAARMVTPENSFGATAFLEGKKKKDEPLKCNVDYCHVCRKHAGEFLCCSRCPRSFHSECIQCSGLVRRDWVCHVCTQEWNGTQDDWVDGKVSYDSMCEAYAEFSANEGFTANMQLLSMIHEMLTKLMDHEFGEFFRHPVDGEAAPGYTDVVSRPMDLGTICKNLISGGYGERFASHGSWDDLLLSIYKDVEQVWHNCFVFCREGSVVRKAAEVLRQRSLMIQKRSFSHLFSENLRHRMEHHVSGRKKSLRELDIGQRVTDTVRTRASVLSGSRWHSLGECLCGGSLKWRNMLSVVVCCTCLEPMHGVCAGFDSEEQLWLETEATAMVNAESGEDLVLRVCKDDRCPCCVAGKCGIFSKEGKKLIQSRATLIVTPPSILSQWEREIRRHTSVSVRDPQGHATSYNSQRPLKAVVYPGIRELCDNRRNSQGGATNIHLIHPHILADADIVLVTFNTLMRELGHSAENPYVGDSSDASSRGRQQRTGLRKRKRYRVVPSPLTSIKWWRVCLDEAQRVEAPTAASAKMALKLESYHRWCVSGTPVGRGKLEDLYGLTLFLGVVPYSNKQMFAQCLQPSHRDVMDRVRHMLKAVFWRSTKACERVRDEMKVPAQIEKKVILRFSSIERHFYQSQLEETILVAHDQTNSGKARRSSQTNLSDQLHRLRAACCHPQVGSSGIGRRKNKRTSGGDRLVGAYGTASTGSGVLTMEQILDRLIDDAKTKCEEAQRLALMHTNALACLSKLKVEAKKFGVMCHDSDGSLLRQSCESYLEALELADSNAQSSTIVGEAVLSGCRGFRSARKAIRNGAAKLDWQIKIHDENPVSLSDPCRSIPETWARFDFEGPSKKVVELKARALREIPSSLIEESASSGQIWRLLRPKDCVLQVSSSSVGGEFVDVVAFTLPGVERGSSEEQQWKSLGGFFSHKSKSWRVFVKNYYCPNSVLPQPLSLQAYYVGMEVQLCEADIAMDDLQRLHALHNASLSLSSLLQQQTRTKDCSGPHSIVSAASEDSLSNEEITKKLKWMDLEAKKRESLYMDAARTIHIESQRQLREAFKARERLESDLRGMTQKVKACNTRLNAGACIWDDGWWDDLLSICHLYASPSDALSLVDKVAGELNDWYENTIAGQASRKCRFPPFHSANGLQVALKRYMEEALSQSGSRSQTSIVQSVQKLSPHPSEAEITENSRCGICRKDWNQTGEKCRHCKLDEKLEKLEHDPLLVRILHALWKWTCDTRSSSRIGSSRVAARIDERAKKFFEAVKATDKERLVARVAWRTHFDLLSDIDELNMCRQTKRFPVEGEDVSKLTEEEKNYIISPWDVATDFMDHSAKQAMAMANLRRHKDTLRFLKTQHVERNEELKRREIRQNSSSDKKDEDNTRHCVVCLMPFEGERAVLACGHSFHRSPCLEKLMRRPGNHSTISCPMRCPLRTNRDKVMIATDKRKDDGSKCSREVAGSWGTKVTRLVGDVMDVRDLGEKCIVFSQWEDMLDVIEHALCENTIHFVRSRSLTHIGESIKHFRSADCTVLLLNVKNGAEGLTLVEATHVFMVEPLLNCGLDSQAINRIHRIGQSCKTYVHRYLIEDTIEIKIDKMRAARQGDQLEDAIHETKRKNAINAGGVDGGFSQEELEDILR